MIFEIVVGFVIVVIMVAAAPSRDRTHHTSDFRDRRQSEMSERIDRSTNHFTRCHDALEDPAYRTTRGHDRWRDG